MTEEAPAAIKRPKIVWAIFIFYVLSFGASVLTMLLSLFDVIPDGVRAQTYLESLNTLDHIMSFMGVGLNLWAALCLFLLKRIAFPLFLASFTFSLISTGYYVIERGFMDMMVQGSWVGYLVGFGIMIGIIIYTKNLSDRGILK